MMGSLKRLLLVLTLVTTNWGCVSLQSISLTQVPKKRSKVVKASASKLLIFGITFDNDFVNDINNQLMDKCSNGRIQGIMTKHFYTNYFLGIVARSSVEARGFCQKG